MSNIQHYSYRVFWSKEDKEFVGACSEFPSLSHLAATQEDALKGIRDLVAFVVSDLAKEGEPIPEPLSEQTYSGNLRVRLPQSLHQRLALEAHEEGRSLNRLIIDRLGSRNPFTGDPGRVFAKAPAKAAAKPKKAGAKRAFSGKLRASRA